MPVSRSHKLVVLGGERVGKTAIIEQFIFGNHVIGQVTRVAVVRSSLMFVRLVRPSKTERPADPGRRVRGHGGDRKRPV